MASVWFGAGHDMTFRVRSYQSNVTGAIPETSRSMNSNRLRANARRISTSRVHQALPSDARPPSPGMPSMVAPKPQATTGE